LNSWRNEMEERKVQKVWRSNTTVILSLPQDWVKKQEEANKRALECVVLKYNEKEVRIRAYPENGGESQ